MFADSFARPAASFQVISEGLRCGNIVKLVHRKVLKDVTYKGKNYRQAADVTAE